jgi:DNA-binding NtrC family response regulator
MQIIVVDDEPVIADTLVDILNGEGYRAVAVSDGASALKWAAMIKPDAVISDIMMPDLNGIDTAKEILKLLPQCRIILFSGHAASTELLNEAKKEGFEFEILAKPVNPDRLLSMLARGRFSAVQTD